MDEEWRQWREAAADFIMYVVDLSENLVGNAPPEAFAELVLFISNVLSHIDRRIIEKATQILIDEEFEDRATAVRSISDQFEDWKQRETNSTFPREPTLH